MTGRGLRAAATAALAGTVLVGCGSGSSERRQPRPGPSAGIDTMGSRVTEAVALGASIPFTGDGNPGAGNEPRELVTVARVFQPAATRGPSGERRAAPAGYRLVEVDLRLRELAAPAYHGNPGGETSLISESTGGYVGRRVAGIAASATCRRNLLRTVSITRGEAVRGCVFFEVPASQRVNAVQFDTHVGIGQNVATWAVNRSDVHG